MDVEQIEWPAERARRGEFAAAGRPRLLLVDGGPPPVSADPLEDWVRLPVERSDLEARIEAVLLRAQARLRGAPDLDDDGVLRFAGRWVALPPLEARLVRAMVDGFGAVVRRDVLTAAGWPSGRPDRNVLDVHVLRLRRRLEPVSLTIRTIRSRGYLLEPRAT